MFHSVTVFRLLSVGCFIPFLLIVFYLGVCSIPLLFVAYYTVVCSIPSPYYHRLLASSCFITGCRLLSSSVFHFGTFVAYPVVCFIPLQFVDYCPCGVFHTATVMCSTSLQLVTYYCVVFLFCFLIVFIVALFLV